MNISTSTSIVIPRPREEVFAFACSNDTYERTLRPRGLIAGIDNQNQGLQAIRAELAG